MATEGNISDGLSATQNAEPEEGYLMKECKSSMESSFPDKSPTENICQSEDCQVDKIENQALTKLFENERRRQMENVETGDDKVEAINDRNIEKSDDHTQNDGAKDSKLACLEEPITDQPASSEVITRTKGEEDEKNMGGINEASLADIALTSKSQCVKDERVTVFSSKDEHIDTTMHVEDEFKEISLAGVQNKKEEMASVLEGGLKDPESIGSCDKLEHEDIKEEDASTVNVTESSYVHKFKFEEPSFEDVSKDGDKEDDKPENSPSNLVTGGTCTEVEIEARKTLQEASNTACKDKNKDETEMDKAEDSACLNRDEKETNEDSKINPEKHDGEKGDSWQKHDQEDEPGEQVVLVPEKTEIAAPRENEDKRDEQKVRPVENFEEEDIDESTSITLSRETSISTEKSLPLVESISEIKSEESIFPENTTDDLYSKETMVEETGQPDSGETGKVPTTEAPEEHQESSKSCAENNEQDEHHSETERTENLVIKHMDSEAMVTTDTTTKSTKDTEELEKVPCSQSEEKSDIKDDEEIIPEEPQEREEATDKRLHETAKESVSEDEAPSGLSTMTPVRDETIETTIQEESLKDGEPISIQKDESHGPEDNAEDNKKADEVFDLPKTTGGQDTYEQQIVEGSVEDRFQENEKEIQNLREHTGREIKGDNYVSDLPLELNRNTKVEEIYSMKAQSDSNPRECSPAEFKSSVESSSNEKSATENICKSEYFQADEIENQLLTQVSDNERQNQSKDVETGGDKVEATKSNDINKEELDHDIENDGAKISRLASAEEPNLKVHEAINSMEKEMITLQTNENTRSKGEKDADSECNERATAISETNLGLMNEAPLPNHDLAIRSQQEEDERVMESCTKDEDTDTTTHVDDEFKEENLTAEQNKKADIPSIMEGEHKDSESIGSSDALEHENNKEEDASTVNIVESTHNDASEDDDNFDDKSENPSSNLVTDGVSTKVAIEAGETQQEASYTGCKDKNIDIYESAGQETNVAPVDGMAACLNRDIRGANEDEIIQSELAETNEDGRTNPEIHNGEKIDIALSSKIQGEENERVIESCAKDEHIDTTKHVEDEFKEKNLPGALEGGLMDREPIGSSDKLEHEDIREEDASAVNIAQSLYIHCFEESFFEPASKDGDNEDEKPENPLSNPVTDGASTQIEVEAGETLQEASSTACKDENKDETEMDKAEDSACLNRDETEANEKDLIQMTVTETNEDGKINPEKHDGEKRDSWQTIDQEDELGEQVILIPEKTETAAPRENVEKRDEQNIHTVEKIEENEEKDEPTFPPDSGDTSVSTEKSLQLAESITNVKSEETIFPEKIADDSNSEDPLVQETGQPDSCETDEVSKVEAAEKHQESSEFCTETKQEEHDYEKQSTDSLVVKHMDSEAMVTTETITTSTKDSEELDKVPEVYSAEKIDIKGNEKIVTAEPKETEEATDKQLHEAAKESVTEDEAPSRSQTTAMIIDEIIEESIEEESLKDSESTLTEKNDSHIPENDAEEEKKDIEAFDLPKAKGSQDIYEQQIIEGSVEKTMNVQDNEKDTKNTKDTGREINRENYVPSLPLEFIQNTGLEEGYSTTAQLDNNPKECPPVECESSVESSSSDKSPTENISKSDHCQADKIENQALTEISENEKQHQKVILGNDVETGEDKVEAINDISKEEPDHEIENDGSTEEPNLKVHEEETSTDNNDISIEESDQEIENEGAKIAVLTSTEEPNLKVHEEETSTDNNDISIEEPDHEIENDGAKISMLTGTKESNLKVHEEETSTDNNDISTEESDHEIENDGAKIAMLTSTEEPGLKVHGEETSMDNSSLEQHLELITDQHASFKVIQESIVKDENTKSKGEEDADLESNEQATSMFEMNLGLINEASLPNLNLTIKSQGREDERATGSCIKDEDTGTAIHVENEFQEPSVTEVQNKKVEMSSILEGELKDTESIGSSDKLEHENNREEDISTVNVVQSPLVRTVDESTSEAAPKKGDGGSTQVANEAGETLKEASYTACKDVAPVDGLDKAEDSACLNRDVRGENEKDIIQTGNGEKRDSWQENDQEDELEEQVILIPEKTEIAAPRENVEKRDEQDLHLIEKTEEEEETDEPTSIPDSGKTPISTEKSLSIAESITKIESEETTFPEKIANSEDLLVKETGQPESGEIGEVSKVEAEEIHQESSEFCTEIIKQEEHHYETQSTDRLVVEHMDSEAMVTTETITTPTKDTEEFDKAPESYSSEKRDIKGDEKVITEEPKETEEAPDQNLHEAAKESASEDKAPSRSLTTSSIEDEPIEESFHEESPEVGESTLIEKNKSHRSENDADENKKSVKDFDLPKTTDGQESYEQQITEGSVEETMNNFQHDGNEIQNSRDDTSREIKGESYAQDLPLEFIENTELVETYSTTVQLDSNTNECSLAESQSSVESSSPDKSPLANICKSEHFQPDEMENQAFTKVSEDERQHQEGVLSKDDETGDDKVEAINDINIEEPHQDIENDGAKISKLALVEEPNPKAHEEEISMDNSSLDQHLELMTDQQASSKVIVESMENEEGTRTKGEEDADLECNEQATNISETNFGLINEFSLSNLDLTNKSQGEEDGRVVNDLNYEDPLVQKTGQPDSDETGEVPKIEAEEKRQESSKFCTKTNKQDEHDSETQSTDNFVIKHMDSEAMATTETITKSTKEENALESHSEEKDFTGDEKIIPEEPTEREETIDKQSRKTVKESVSEDEAPSRLPTTETIRDETLEVSFQEKSLKDGESTLIEKNENHIPENDAKKDEKAVEVIAGCNDSDREIKGENYIPNLPPEFIQHGTTDDTVLSKSNQNVENPEKVSDMLPNKSEESLLGEHDNSTPKEALTEDQDEYACSNVADDNGETSGQAKEKEKLEVPDMIPMESEVKASKEDSENTTCTEGEETTTRLEKTSEKKEMTEEAKDIDGTEENKASNQEVPTASSETTIENILKECEPSETEAAVSKPEEETENTVETLSSATVGMKTGKEYLKEDEKEETKMKDEFVVTESKGQIEATDLIEEKVSNTLDDCSEPKDNCPLSIEEDNDNLVKGSSSIPGVHEKDSSSTNDSDIQSLRVVDDNTAIKEVPPVDKEQLEGADAAPNMMNLTTIETNSNCLGGVDIAERQEEEINSELNRDMEVGGVVDPGEKISQDIKDKDLITGINHEKATPLITHTEGVLAFGSSDNEKEYSKEGTQKHKDGDRLMPLDLKTETNISESDTEDREKWKEEQVGDLADQNGACKLEIQEDQKSTIEATKGLLQEEKLADETDDSSAVIGVEREAASLSSQEESIDTKTSKLQMEKGDFEAKNESEETLLHFSNNQTEGKDNNLQDQDSQFVQEVIRLQFEGDTEKNKKPRCNDEELLNLSLDQDEKTKAFKLTQEVHQRLGTAGTGESGITSPAEETGNEVEVSTSEFTEQIESIKSTEEKESVTLEDYTERNMDNTNFSALKSPDASETCTEVSSSISKVYEKENEAGFLKKDEPVTDDPKNVPVIVEIEERGIKNTGPGHVVYDKGSDIEVENKSETAVVTDNIKSDSIDIIEREEENSNPEKKGILEELNKGHLIMESSVKETDKTTTVQHEKELTTSSIPISQDNPALFIEEKGALWNATDYPMEITSETAETYLAHSAENKSLQKEHELVKPGGVSESEPVDITNECSNNDSPKLENEEKEEKLSVDASKCTASTTYEDSEATKKQQNLDTTFEGSFTNVAIEKAAIALETKDVSHENEPTDEFPSEKTVEEEDINEKVELASKAMVKDQRDEKSYQAEEERNLEDHIFESRDSVPGQKFQGERELDMQFVVEQHTSVPTNAQEASVSGNCAENALAETEKANESGNILEHTPEPNSSLKEPDNLSAGYETVNELQVTATDSRFIEETEKMDLVEDRESRTLENFAKVAEDFSSSPTIEASVEGIHKEESEKNLLSKVEIFDKEDDTNTFETLPCVPETKDLTVTDKVKTGLDTLETGDIEEESSNSEDSRDKQSPEIDGEGGREIDDDTRDEAPTTEDKHEKEEDTSLTQKPNNSLQNPSVIQTEEDDPLRTNFSNSIDNQASDDQTFKIAETTFVVHTVEKKLPQSNHGVIKPVVSSELEIAVVKNENANKEIQRQEDDDLCDLNSQGTISDSKDVKISRTEESSGVIDQNGAGTLEEVIVAGKIATESDPGGNKHESAKTEQSEFPAEKGHDGVDRAGGSKNIDEQMINYAVSSMELQTLSGKDETVNQVKDRNLVFTKDLEATDSSKHTAIADLGIEDDPTGKESSINDPAAGHQVLEGKVEKKTEAGGDNCINMTETMPVEKNSSLFAQLHHTADENVGREMQFPENPEGHFPKDFKIAPPAVEFKDKDVENDIKGSSEMISRHDRVGVEAFPKDKTGDDQILLPQNSEEKLQTQSSSGNKICEDSQRDSSNKVHEEGRAPDVAVQLEPHEKGEKEYINSLPESEQIKEAIESEEAAKLRPEENQSEVTTATEETVNTAVSNEKIKEEQEAVKDFQQTYDNGRDRMSDQETEQRAIEYPIKKTHTIIQTINKHHQHEVKFEANGNAKDVLPDDTEGKHVTQAATRLTHQVEKDQEIDVNRPQKGHVDPAEASEHTRAIQKQEESSLGTVDIKLGEKADAESRKTKEDVEKGPQNPDEETMPKLEEEIISLSDILHRTTEEPLQADKHLNETTEEAAKTPKAETPHCEEAKEESGKEEGGGDEDSKTEPMSLSGDSVMVEASRAENLKVAQKKSHNILSGVGSKVKHSISKVKKAITGKSSHPKTQSPK